MCSSPCLHGRNADFLRYSGIMIGSQHVSKFETGAYRGETLAQMIKDAGNCLCLTGHVKRRQMINENDPSCKIKVEPVLGVAEVVDQCESGITNEVLQRQLHGVLEGQDLTGKNLAIAYEPV